ncbi:MAG: Uma2 family endonuclease [Saprospiraceae bacterium]|nr:Uma2 family endonuclease [Saprospiraceae bacterium]
MTTAAILEKIPTSKGHEGGPALISTEAFYRRYGQREDGFKYELVNGRIENSEKNMDDSQLHIAANLSLFFYSLKLERKSGGTFLANKYNVLWKDHVRKPDMCYLNQQQLVEAYEGKHPVAEFVVEVVSPTDKAYKYSEKIEDYFKAGVKVVWMIYPNTKQVQVHLHNSTNVTYCKGEMICSAAPVLPEFAISVNDIFKKPTVD